ncbi:hypothetical protein BH10BAC3_BH10BAC3_17340 [soil metagenome]
MKYLILLAFVALASCTKQTKDFRTNKFEVSFVSYGSEKISKYTLFASSDGKNFLPVKDITPAPGTDTEYKVQFVIPQDKLNADGKVLFYMEETAAGGSVSKTEIVTVE